MNKEIAERASGDSSILSQVNKRLDGFDAVFDAKIKGDIRKMADQLDAAIKSAEEAREGIELKVTKEVEERVKSIKE